MVESIKEGKKVTCEMVHILYPAQIQDLKSENVWPPHFHTDLGEVPENKPSFTEYRDTKTNVSDGSESDDSLEGNVNQMNRPVVYLSSDSDSDSDD